MSRRHNSASAVAVAALAGHAAASHNCRLRRGGTTGGGRKWSRAYQRSAVSGLYRLPLIALCSARHRRRRRRDWRVIVSAAGTLWASLLNLWIGYRPMRPPSIRCGWPSVAAETRPRPAFGSISERASHRQRQLIETACIRTQTRWRAA